MNNDYQIIIGLGNPGEKYSKTRHNAGFIILDEIQKMIGSSDFKSENKFNVEISEKVQETGNHSGFIKKLFNKNSNRRIILVKPQSFMNRSGEVIRKFIDFYKVSPEEITVIHDDLDLPMGTFKISENSGAGGHNGVQSIIDMLGTKEFRRIRIGVEKEEGRESRQTSGEKFVLQNLSDSEESKIRELAKGLELF